MKTTSFFGFGEKQNLNGYDKKVLEYYQEILNLIIAIAKQESIKEIEIIDKKHFNVVDTASMMIESYMSVLQFYRNIESDITKREIEVIEQIQENLKLDDELLSEEKPNPDFITYYLRNLGAQGILNVIKGIIVGKPQNEKYYEEYKDVYRKVLKEFDRVDMPVLYNVNFGHSSPIGIIPYGIECELDVDNKKIILLESVIR